MIEKLRAALPEVRSQVIDGLRWARDHKGIVLLVAGAASATLTRVWPDFPADEALRALAALLAA